MIYATVRDEANWATAAGTAWTWGRRARARRWYARRGEIRAMTKEAGRKPILEIDGARFDDLAGFFDEVSRQLVPGARWGHNLDAFHDILYGGFGTPEEGFVLRRRERGVP